MPVPVISQTPTAPSSVEIEELSQKSIGGDICICSTSVRSYNTQRVLARRKIPDTANTKAGSTSDPLRECQRWANGNGSQANQLDAVRSSLDLPQHARTSRSGHYDASIQRVFIL